MISKRLPTHLDAPISALDGRMIHHMYIHTSLLAPRNWFAVPHVALLDMMTSPNPSNDLTWSYKYRIDGNEKKKRQSSFLIRVGEDHAINFESEDKYARS